MIDEKKISYALQLLQKWFPTEVVNIEINFYAGKGRKETKISYNVYVPSVGVGRDCVDLEDAMTFIKVKGGIQD